MLGEESKVNLCLLGPIMRWERALDMQEGDPYPINPALQDEQTQASGPQENQSTFNPTKTPPIRARRGRLQVNNSRDSALAADLLFLAR